MTFTPIHQFLAYTEQDIAELRYRRERLAKALAETDQALAEREKQAQVIRKEIERMEREST